MPRKVLGIDCVDGVLLDLLYILSNVLQDLVVVRKPVFEFEAFVNFQLFVDDIPGEVNDCVCSNGGYGRIEEAAPVVRLDPLDPCSKLEQIIDHHAEMR